MARAYKVKWTPKDGTGALLEGSRSYRVLLAKDLADLYERLLAGAFPDAKREGEIHITPIGEAV